VSMHTDSSRHGFWQDRLADDWSESGVGYQALGRPFNRWMYAIRSEVFRDEVSALGLDLSTAKVCDVGSGTGFYLTQWRTLGVRDLTGSDLTSVAAERLAHTFPDVTVHQVDLSAGPGDLPTGVFDAVSCIDTLFHITDDDGYRTAIDTLGQLVRPGGYLLFTENFVHGPVQRGPNQVNRPIEEIESLVEAAGLNILHRRPMGVLGNAQVDAPKPWRKTWGGALRAATLTAPTGWLAGALLYPIERTLVRTLSESPTFELMVCRRPTSG